ncbi:MAG: hypothetical protein LH615_04605 [Ferruginibacter sp.]|nr:hypothetical protein [Ferruginibacter sp.]
MKLSISIMVAFVAIIFSSCQKDTSEETGQIPSGGTTIINPGGTVNNAGCKNCIYYPICSPSVYKYSDTGLGFPTGTVNTYTLTYVKDTTLENKTYKKFSVTGQGNTYFNCTAGVSSSIVLNGTTQGGNIISYAKVTVLKENAPINTSWVDTLTASGQTALYTYTIVSKGIPRTVAGINYTDVIHVHEQTTVNVAGTIIPAGQSDYYYAKGIGLIESISFDDFTGLQILRHVLISATIP